MTTIYQDLLALDAYATQHNIAPSFTYSGGKDALDRLEQIAPKTAGRFRLRAAIDELRASMEAAI